MILQVLSSNRAFLYKTVRKSENKNDPEVTLELIRYVKDFPSELAEKRLRMLHFITPNFSKYIVMDDKKIKFIIKDTLTN